MSPEFLLIQNTVYWETQAAVAPSPRHPGEKISRARESQASPRALLLFQIFWPIIPCIPEAFSFSTNPVLGYLPLPWATSSYSPFLLLPSDLIRSLWMRGLTVFNLTSVRVGSSEGFLRRVLGSPLAKWFWSEIWRMSDSYTTKCSWQTSWEGTAGKDCSGRKQSTEKNMCGWSTERWNKDQQQRDSKVRPGSDSTPPWLGRDALGRIQIKLKIMIGSLRFLEESAKC